MTPKLLSFGGAFRRPVIGYMHIKQAGGGDINTTVCLTIVSKDSSTITLGLCSCNWSVNNCINSFADTPSIHSWMEAKTSQLAMHVAQK